MPKPLTRSLSCLISSLAGDRNRRRHSKKKAEDRKSLRNSIKKAEERHGPPDNKIVRYSGVSVSFLKQLRDHIVAETVASGVELYVLAQEIEVQTSSGKKLNLSAGVTVRVKRRLRNGKLKCRVQYVGAFDLEKGVSLHFKPRNQWTIEDICEFVVLEETRDEKLFYLDLLDNETEVGQRFQGAFLSQARKSCFSELVDSLLHYYEGKNLTKQFVWFDVFCANQPLLTNRDEDLPEDIQKKREELLSAGLHDAISAFDERIIYFNSWLDPYPLQRAWCVWEIFGCVKSKKSIDILFQPNEDEVFIRTLLQDRGEATKRIADIRLEDAQCFVESDKRGIDEAVESQVGYHKLNVTISSLIIKWLRIFAERVIEKRRQQKGSNRSGEFARILHEAGIFFRIQLGEHDLAMKVLKESLGICKKLYGKKSVMVVAVLGNIASVLTDKGEYDAAINQFVEILRIQEKTHGSMDHHMVATMLQNMALVLQLKGEYDAALERYDQILRILEKLFGGRGNLTVATTLNNIAGILHQKGEYDAALKQLDEVLCIQEKMFVGRDHPDVATTLNNIAGVLNDKGEYDRALKQYEEALRIQEKVYGGRDHPDVARTLSNIATVLHRKGESDAALKQFEEALRIQEKVYGGRDRPEVAVTLNNIAMVLQQKGKYDPALQQYEEALRIQEKVYGGRDHPDVARALNNIAGILHQKGENDAALKQFEEALRIQEKVYGGRDHPEVAITLNNIARVLQQKGEYDAALKQYEEALQIHEKVYGGRDHPEVAIMLNNIATVLHGKGEYDAALKQYEEALHIQEMAYGGRDHPSVLQTLMNIAFVFMSKGESEAVEKYLKEAMRIEVKMSSSSKLTPKEGDAEVGGLLKFLTQPAKEIEGSKKEQKSSKLSLETSIEVFEKILQRMQTLVVTLANHEEKLREAAAQRGKAIDEAALEQYLMGQFRKTMSEVEQAVCQEFNTSEEEVKDAMMVYNENPKFQKTIERLRTLFKAVIEPQQSETVESKTVELPDHVTMETTLAMMAEILESINDAVEATYADLQSKGLHPQSPEFQNEMKNKYMQDVVARRKKVCEKYEVNEEILHFAYVKYQQEPVFRDMLMQLYNAHCKLLEKLGKKSS